MKIIFLWLAFFSWFIGVIAGFMDDYDIAAYQMAKGCFEMLIYVNWDKIFE